MNMDNTNVRREFNENNGQGELPTNTRAATGAEGFAAPPSQAVGNTTPVNGFIPPTDLPSHNLLMGERLGSDTLQFYFNNNNNFLL